MSQEKTTADFEKSRQDNSSTPNEYSQPAGGGELQQIAKQARIESVISFEFAKELALEKSSMRLK